MARTYHKPAQQSAHCKEETMHIFKRFAIAGGAVCALSAAAMAQDVNDAPFQEK